MKICKLCKKEVKRYYAGEVVDENGKLTEVQYICVECFPNRDKFQFEKIVT